MPTAWNLSTLEGLPELYEPVATMPKLVCDQDEVVLPPECPVCPPTD